MSTGSTGPSLGRQRVSWGLVAAAYVVLGLALTWPAALHMSSRLAAPVGPGDPYLNVWILGWDLRVLCAHPAALLTGRIFQANIFYPADLTLAYSEHLIPQAMLLVPLYAATGNLTACYNALLLASLVGSALAMFAFVRATTGSTRGAFVAGVAWGFAPYHFAHLLHLQLQSLYLLPLTFLFLHRLLAARRRLDAVLLGTMAGLQVAASLYYGLIGGVGLAVALAVLAVTTGQWRSRRLAGRLLLAAGVALVVSGPFVWPYWQVQRQEGFARTLYEASQHAARPRSYLQVPPGNILYGRTGVLRPRSADVRQGAGPEGELFPGFVLAALATVGFWRNRRGARRPLAWAFLGLVLAGFVLSLGPDGVRPIYASLHRWVFGFQAIRAPARFGVLVLFGLAGLAALPWTERGMASRRGWAALVFGLLVAEYANVPLPTVPAPATDTAVGRWLAAQPEPGAVLYLPLGLEEENTPAMVASLQHGRRIVNGCSGQRPRFFVALVEALRGFPSPEALWTLRDLDVRFVVSPEAAAVPPGSTASPLVERARLDRAVVYELRWTPEVEAALPRPFAPAPPPPGPIPFVPGEMATYRVTWSGGVGGLAAGQAVFRVDRADPQGDDTAPQPRYRFTLEAETAPWVSRFFEAHDRFETITDRLLLPLVGRQSLREGRREVDRVTWFDHVSHLVDTGALTLPMAPGSRDPLAAFYYARARLSGEDAAWQIPVSDGGRNLIVDIRRGGVESILAGGTRQETIRLHARIEHRVERRRPIEAIIWASRDARRIPLVLEVSAGFGAFRAELVEYRAR